MIVQLFKRCMVFLLLFAFLDMAGVSVLSFMGSASVFGSEITLSEENAKHGKESQSMKEIWTCTSANKVPEAVLQSLEKAAIANPRLITDLFAPAVPTPPPNTI